MVAETSWAFSLEDGDGHSNTVRSGSNEISHMIFQFRDSVLK